MPEWTSSAGRGAPQPNRLESFLRHGWPIVVVGAVLGGIVGVAASATVTQHYTASTSVNVTPTGVDDNITIANSRTTGSVNLDTESNIVTSSVVAEAVQKLDKRTRTTNIADLLKPVTVSVPSNTSILTISYDSTSAADAARLANDFGRAYLANRAATAQSAIQVQTTKVDDELTKLTAEYEQLGTEKAKLKPADKSQIQLIDNRRVLVRGLIKSLTTQQTNLTTTAITPGTVLTSATAPANPSSPSQTLYGGGGFALGLLIALAVAWLRFAVRVRARRPGDVVRKLQLPVVASVEKGSAAALVPADSRESQEYRRAFNVLVTASPTPGIIVVTGRCGAATTDSVVANLARAGRLAGTPVRALSLNDDSALSRFLGDEADGVVLDRPAGDATSHAELDRLRGTNYLLVAAAENDNGSAIVQAIAARSSAVVLVVAAHSLLRKSADLLDELDVVGAPIFGAVLVPTERAHRVPSAEKDGGPAKSGGRDSVAKPKADAKTDAKTDAKSDAKPTGAPAASAAKAPATDNGSDPDRDKPDASKPERDAPESGSGGGRPTTPADRNRVPGRPSFRARNANARNAANQASQRDRRSR